MVPSGKELCWQSETRKRVLGYFQIYSVLILFGVAQ